MISFKSLSLRNFLSYGNETTTIRLDQSGTTMIVGDDLDNTSSGQGTNGCGKTVLINALSYAVYDKPVSNISKDNLVNNINKKNMEVSVIFECEDIFYKITRVRKSKSYAAGNYVKVYKRANDVDFDESDDITPDSISHANALIERIIGIPHELFVRIVVFSATHTPFLDLPVRHPTAPCQTKIIEELFDLTELADDALTLKEIIKENQAIVNTKTIQLESLERELGRHNEQLASTKRRIVVWQQDNEKTIDELESKLKLIDDVDVDAQESIHAQLTEAQNNIDDMTSQRKMLKQDIINYTSDKTKITSELDHLKTNKCPYCMQSFADNKKTIAGCKKSIKLLESKIELSSDKLSDIESNIVDGNLQLKSIQSKITVTNVGELINIKNQSSTIRDKIAELQSAINPFIEPYDELSAMEVDVLDYDELNKITNVITHQKFLLKLLTKKDSFVRKALLHKNIPFLNSRLHLYLQELGLPHTVEFSQDLTAHISQFGRLLEFGNLSNGQRARVNIALSFAFRDVLQKLHTEVNLCMLDEVLDAALDAVGVKAAAKMLKRKGREENASIFIISHRDEIDSAFDRKMIVQMSKGFSSIVSGGDV